METIVHSQSSDTMLDIQHLYKSFPGVVAVNDVGCQIRRGEVHVLIGENGKIYACQDAGRDLFN